MKSKNKKICRLITAFIVAACLNTITYAAEPLSAEQIQLQKDQEKYQAYIPKNYELFEALQGDLNQDAKNDVVLIVKATDPKAWVHDEYRGDLDRNRRGILVLVNKNGAYQKVLQNLSLFSSENEDGGVYFAPELAPSVEKGNLKIHYAHGRYGYWTYTFRLEGNDMRLIGYDDSSNHGPYIDNETSINFLTQKNLCGITSTKIMKMIQRVLKKRGAV